MKNMNEIAAILFSSEEAKEKTKRAIEDAKQRDASNIERLLFLDIHLTQIKEYIEMKSENGDNSIDYTVSGFPSSCSSVDLFLELSSFVKKAGYDVEFSLRHKTIIIKW